MMNLINDAATNQKKKKMRISVGNDSIDENDGEVKAPLILNDDDYIDQNRDNQKKKF